MLSMDMLCAYSPTSYPLATHPAAGLVGVLDRDAGHLIMYAILAAGVIAPAITGWLTRRTPT